MSGSARGVARTVATLALLGAVAPANVALTAVALARGAVGGRPGPTVADSPRTVLISGGKMTKALHLARAFHRAGHRVVLVESERYRLTGHRFSAAVDAFHVVPKPADPGYAQALLDIVVKEGVDVYVPVCSPGSSHFDALAKPLLAEHCDVVHLGPDVLDDVDDKYRFFTTATALGLSVPDTHRITSPAELAAFEPPDPGVAYIAKSIPYDPVHRLDLTPLPRPTPQERVAFARSKPVSGERPWIIQELLEGTEYCTHSTVRDGQVQVWCCCESSAFQVNYEMVDKPGIEAWVRAFVEPLALTGQVSFDFIETADGRVRAIECNPRTHSAITMFYDHPDLARAYLDAGVATVRPTAASRPTYWLYHELWRMLTHPAQAGERLRVVARGREAIFDWDDPLPFLLVHHLQVPSLLLGALRDGREWIRIDFNIGKLVEAGGD